MSYEKFCEELKSEVLCSEKFRNAGGIYVFHNKGEKAEKGDIAAENFIVSTNVKYFKSEHPALMGDFIELGLKDKQSEEKKFSRYYVPSLYEVFERDGWNGVWNEVEENLRYLDQMDESVTDVIEKMSEYSKIRNKLVIRPLSFDQNSMELKKSVYRLCGDIALVLYGVVSDDPETGVLNTFKIPRELAEGWGTDIDKVFDQAMLNTHLSAMPRVYTNISDALSHPSDKGKFMSPDSDVEALSNIPGSAPMLTTTKRVNGAVAMFYPGVQEKISELFGGSYYAAFTSIHEVMLHKEGTIEPSMIRRSLIDVNRHFGPEEALTENVYFYDAEKNEFRMLEAEDAAEGA